MGMWCNSERGQRVPLLRVIFDGTANSVRKRAMALVRTIEL
jgi:hypothetical protein